MKHRSNWIKFIHVTGIIALILGIIDPLEGSVVVALGSGLVALSTSLRKDRHHKLFFICFLMIAVGVALLFYFSSLGGFGGRSSLSWWWAALLIPYPAGWLITMGLLILGSGRAPHRVANT
ncbi:MAG: hypothetical protein ACM3VS_03510 [Candidatus Dadabacteria bacterium]